MSVVSCRCLNVILSPSGCSNQSEPLPPGSSTIAGQPIPLAPTPGQLRLFTQGLRQVSDLSIVSCQEKLLLTVETLQKWMVTRCQLCLAYTHAVSTEPSHEKLINMALIMSKEEYDAIIKTEYYSPLFKLLTNEIKKTDADPKYSIHGQSVANFNKRMKLEMRSKLEDMEEEIRLFRESKYKAFEEFRERAKEDYSLISSALNQVDLNDLPTGAESKDVHMLEPGGVFATKKSMAPQIVTVVSKKPKRSVFKVVNDSSSFKEDSLDNEDVFDLEGMDSSVSPDDEHISDAYDSDSNDSVSKDEGIHIARDNQQSSKQTYAKSLPMNVPIFTHFHERSQDHLNEDQSHDIAASIKALARSIHSDVFDLPRPRFSTQI